MMEAEASLNGGRCKAQLTRVTSVPDANAEFFVFVVTPARLRRTVSGERRSIHLGMNMSMSTSI